jgi:hypothetical protein
MPKPHPACLRVAVAACIFAAVEDVSDSDWARDPQKERAGMEASLTNLMTSSAALHARVDGRGFGDEEIRTYAETAPEFSLSAAERNAFDFPSGRRLIAHARGYYLMLPPLATGDHLIEFGATGPIFAQPVEVTVRISVQ